MGQILKNSNLSSDDENKFDSDVISPDVKYSF
jgi:hypothetical protein